MALTTTSFGTTFDLSGTPNVFLFVDTTNYVGQGVSASDCKCVLEITAPGGVIYYQNTNFSNPDINPGVSPTNIIPIQVPLGANGLPVPGSYTFQMTTQVDDGIVTPYTVITSYSFTYSYVSPVVSINQTANCVTPLFTSTDNTVYTVNNVIPSISRQHNIFFPVGSGLSTINGTAEVITLGSNQFANGTQTTQIITSLNYVMDSNVNITDSVTGALEILVSCEWTCQISCCLKALNNRMESQRSSNYQAFLQTKDIFTQVMSKVTLVMQMLTCGQEDGVNAVISQIQELANCTDNCCGQDTPSLVNGISGGAGYGNVIVQSGGSPIAVTSVTVGDTTTYTVSIDSAFVTQVNGHYNTAMADNDGITWTSSGPVGGVVTWTPHLATAPLNSLAFKIKLIGTNTTLTYAVSDVVISGSTFQSPTVAPYVALPANAASPNGFVVNGFYSGTSSDNFKVNTNLVVNSYYAYSGTLTKIQKGSLISGIGLFRQPGLWYYALTLVGLSNGQFNFRLDKYNDITDKIAPTTFQDFYNAEINAEIHVLITE
jgi:hypothetical protein